MADRIGVQFEFPERNGLPPYRDTLWFETLEAFQATSKGELEAMKLARYAGWRQAITDAQNAPPEPRVVPTPDEAMATAQSVLEAAQALVASLQEAQPVPSAQV
jgi:hypothetical protein